MSAPSSRPVRGLAELLSAARQRLVQLTLDELLQDVEASAAGLQKAVHKAVDQVRGLEERVVRLEAWRAAQELRGAAVGGSRG